MTRAEKIMHGLVLGMLWVAAGGLSAPAGAGPMPSIRDDPQLDRAIAEVRTEFLAGQKFDRLNVALLLSEGKGRWRRGSFNGTVLAYPASCVKLAYLVAAVHWCRSRGRSPGCLDGYVRPMTVKSDNIATGFVVDQITGAPNYQTRAADATFQAWQLRRSFTERYLKAHGLLANQHIANKTYPSNSGESPNGAEQLAVRLRGRNAMQPIASASLMLGIVKGKLEPAATAYMREALVTERFDENSVLGFGLPPGSRYENKNGVAYDTLEDIAYIVLPNGQELILAAYSNGWDKDQPPPYDAAGLGVFAEMLIERLQLDRGNPPKLVLDSTSRNFHTSGDWQTESVPAGKRGSAYLSSGSGAGDEQAVWVLDVPETGRYEVAVRYPQAINQATDAPFTVLHAGGATTIRLNQQVWGDRWVKLGDFQFEAHRGQVVLSNKIADPSRRVVADSVKITRWPDRPVSKSSQFYSAFKKTYP